MWDYLIRDISLCWFSHSVWRAFLTDYKWLVFTIITYNYLLIYKIGSKQIPAGIVIPHTPMYQNKKKKICASESSMDWVIRYFNKSTSIQTELCLRQKSVIVFLQLTFLQLLSEDVSWATVSISICIQASFLPALLRLPCCSWAPLKEELVIKPQDRQGFAENSLMRQYSKRIIKISFTLCSSLHNLNDLGKSERCLGVSNLDTTMWMKSWHRCRNDCLLHFLLKFTSTHLRGAACSDEPQCCFSSPSTNQGHCMLVKFTVAGINGVNAQAHNKHYSLNIVKWPYCEDDFIFLFNTAKQEMSLAVRPETLSFPY